jgi:hypothetical protein
VARLDRMTADCRFCCLTRKCNWRPLGSSGAAGVCSGWTAAPSKAAAADLQSVRWPSEPFNNNRDGRVGSEPPGAPRAAQPSGASQGSATAVPAARRPLTSRRAGPGFQLLSGIDLVLAIGKAPRPRRLTGVAFREARPTPRASDSEGGSPAEHHRAARHLTRKCYCRGRASFAGAAAVQSSLSGRSRACG